MVGRLMGLASPMDSGPNIRNKIIRGKFTAVFLIQCLEAIEARELRLQSLCRFAVSRYSAL